MYPRPGASRGSDLTSIIQGAEVLASRPDDRLIYCEEHREDAGFDLFSIRYGSSKLIKKEAHRMFGSSNSLFDLAQDPMEQADLAAEERKLHAPTESEHRFRLKPNIDSDGR